MSYSLLIEGGGLDGLLLLAGKFGEAVGEGVSDQEIMSAWPLRIQ